MSFDDELNQINKRAEGWILDRTVTEDFEPFTDENERVWQQPPQDRMVANSLLDYGGLDRFVSELQELLPKNAPASHRVACARKALKWYVSCEYEVGGSFAYNYLGALIESFLECIAQGVKADDALQDFFSPKYQVKKRGRMNEYQRRALTFVLTRRIQAEQNRTREKAREKILEDLSLTVRQLQKDDAAVKAAFVAEKPDGIQRLTKRAVQRFNDMSADQLWAELAAWINQPHAAPGGGINSQQ